MIDPSEEEMSGGVDRGGVVSNRFITIFADQTRAGGQVKYKLLAERAVDPILTSSNRRLIVLDPLERVACHRGKSGRPAISKRKNVTRVEESSPDVLRTNVGLEIGLVLVSGINAGVEGKPCRKVMRK